MILKFILLGSICVSTPESDIKCGQYIKNNLLNASECGFKAKHIGMTMKDKMLKLGGSIVEYKVHCIAVDKKGYNVDHSFKISYNIL